MPVLFGGFSLLLLALWIYCLFDVATAASVDVRALPKPLWLVVVLLLPDVGAIAWLLLGRPRVLAAASAGRLAAAGPDDDEEFLRGLRARVEEQRRHDKKPEEDGPGPA
ncbi:PLDc N-terminal domain-containing protein [Actinocorallia longicatena]|uniref:PLDc N-terminal domain-containing protein n=1 Tax=Actinocorallia longicatena TaxID=111803 RepID=A0ABP6QA95_9ACTN